MPAWSRGGWTGTASGRGARHGGSWRRDDGEETSGPAHRTRAALAHTVGREVFHESFGRGVVVAAEGEGTDLKFTVRFGTRVRKVLGRFLTGGSDVH